MIGWSGTAAGWLGFDTDARLCERIQQRIGIDVVAERHLGICVNHDFALVDTDTLRTLMLDVAASAAQAISTHCTNLRAAPLADGIEATTGIPLLDTVSTTVWGMLRAAGHDPAGIRG